MEVNNYKEGKDQILNSAFSVKSVKTFMGMEGSGVNANLYLGGKCIATLIDSGNGGCMNIDYISKDGKFAKDNEVFDTFIKGLPKCTWRDYNNHEGWRKNGLEDDDDFNDSEHKWDDETVCNTLINEVLSLKEFNKAMKKVCILTKAGEVFSYKVKPTDLDNDVRYEGKMIPIREYLLIANDGGTILNELDKEEARILFRKHS